ncbi:hypothetical protein SKAU_G00403760 [Synaphobranchus kaupii]|uniref:Uncharacterized protein n=1 Tax=Synaphobranchus kaupii TaxID=118154 RepID=A0A9Q1E9J1_SYNKA|nr:hypothetical protein SKAU_G00403760 [Synaphobranchus kaupii]
MNAVMYRLLGLLNCLEKANLLFFLLFLLIPPKFLCATSQLVKDRLTKLVSLATCQPVCEVSSKSGSEL